MKIKLTVNVPIGKTMHELRHYFNCFAPKSKVKEVYFDFLSRYLNPGAVEAINTRDFLDFSKKLRRYCK